MLHVSLPTPGAAGFFLEEHRLCNPMYSDLFQDLLKREEASSLRKYLSGKDCTIILLNVCFERPLAIIRSEKNSSTPTGKTNPSHLAAYGINQWNSPSAQRKLEIARQDIELKQKFLAAKVVEEAKSEEAFQATTDQFKSSASSPALQSENQAAIQAKEIACEAVKRAKKELEDAKQAYAEEVLKARFPDTYDVDMPAQRPMTTSALELQHQGFKIVEILTSHDSRYLHEQNDVVRALRWLWRSRGRHYRLLHEEEMPPRYHHESLILAKFLMSYSKANPADVDVLFDLIRELFHQHPSLVLHVLT